MLRAGTASRTARSVNGGSPPLRRTRGCALLARVRSWGQHDRDDGRALLTAAMPSGIVAGAGREGGRARNGRGRLQDQCPSDWRWRFPHRSVGRTLPCSNPKISPRYATEDLRSEVLTKCGISLLPETTGMNYRSPMISGRQIRAARALVGWKQRELAAAAGISEISIKNAERGLVDSRGSTLNAIQQAFDRAGVIFLDNGDTRSGGPGVRLKPDNSP